MQDRFIIADTSRIYNGVTIGKNSVIEDFVLIGVPYKDKHLDTQDTRMGSNALIRSHTVIYSGNQIGDDFQSGHGVLIREKNRIGSRVSVGSHSVIEHHVQIGDGVRIHSNVFIPEYSILEENCWVGPNVVFTNARYPLGKNVKKNLKGPQILSGAKIGANATILPGITIGRNALIGAGSVVTRDVPDGKVAAGNPAKIIGDISDIPDYTGASDEL